MAPAKSDNKPVKVDLTTGIGTLSFPRVFPTTAAKKDDGSPSYDVQILIPKSDRESARKIVAAIREVGESKWGDNWKKVNTPLRDGDKEAGDLTEDGSTKGEKYPERAGHYFINARSSKPVGVYARDKSPIPESDADQIYGGIKGRVSGTFYAYSNNGNHGIAFGLNAIQKIADGEPFGSARLSVDEMFDALEDDDLDGLDAEVDEAPAPPKAAAKKAPAKKAAAKKAAPAPAEDDEDDLDIGGDAGDEDDLYDDLDG